jgi:hypothetical protein
MNKKIITGIVVLAVAVMVLSTSLFMEKQTAEAPIISPRTAEPESLSLSTGGYVYDKKLNYGFNYPDGWEFSIGIDKDLEQCDPALNYEAYNCVEFPDRAIKKNIIFKKAIPGDGSLVSIDIDFVAKTAMDLQVIREEFKRGAVLSGLEILKEEAILVNNTDGYDMLAGIPEWKIRQTAFLSNEMAYVFTYQSQDEFYRIYEKTFNSIINSFSIK